MSTCIHIDVCQIISMLPITVIRKVQLVPVFLWHADKDKVEKLSNLYLVSMSVQNNYQTSARKSQVFKILSEVYSRQLCQDSPVKTQLKTDGCHLVGLRTVACLTGAACREGSGLGVHGHTRLG